MLNILKRIRNIIFSMLTITALIFLLQYNYSAKMVREISDQGFNLSFQTVSNNINHWFYDKEKVIEDSLIYFSLEKDPKGRKLYLQEKLAANPAFRDIYFVSEDNVIINAVDLQHPPGVDFRKRDWYQRALETDTVAYSEAFMNINLTSKVLSMSKALYDHDGSLLGVAAGNISLSQLSALLKECDKIPGAIAFISDKDDFLLVDGHGIVLDQISKEKFIASRKGEVLSKEFEKNGWKLNVFIPSSYLMGPINNLRSIFAFALLFLLGSTAVFLLIQRKVVTEPLVSYDFSAKEEIEKEKRSFQALFKNSSDAIAILSKDNKVLDINKKFEELFSYSRLEAIGKEIDLLVVPHDRKGEGKKYTEKIFQGRINSAEIVRKDKHGNLKDVEIKGAPIVLRGLLLGGYVIYTDITERKKYEREILYMSYHDHLTGLYNRRYFEKQIRKLDQQENLPIYLIMADLNGLKLANDAFGHTFGDQVLKETGRLLSKHLTGQEFVARIGGDEFIIVIPKRNPDEFRQLFAKIRGEVRDSQMGNFQLSISFGWEIKTQVDEDIYDIMNKAESYMYKRKLLEGPSMISNTIDIIITTLHEKNLREKMHSERVGLLGAAIAEEMGFSPETIKEIKLVGLLHDIGKIGIDENILNKEGKLTDEEYDEIKKHPEIGYRILSTSNQMSDIAQYVLSHHERWDGLGYPSGLKGIEAPLIARIIAVADAFDAMTSQRTYRDSLTEEEAAQELLRCAGTQFDPSIVQVFVEKVLKH